MADDLGTMNAARITGRGVEDIHYLLPYPCAL